MATPTCRGVVRAVLGGVIGIGVLASAHALPVTYIVAGAATGGLGTASFVSASFTLTAQADTGNIVEGSRPTIRRVDNASLSLWIAGVGTAGFSNPTITASNWTSGGSAGMGDSVQNRGIVFVNTAALANWALTPSIGPVAGAASGVSDPPVEFATTAGLLKFTAFDDVSFQAIAVPEPASWALLGAGTLALLDLCRRRQGARRSRTQAVPSSR